MPAACGRRRSGEAVLPHARAALAAVAAIRSTRRRPDGPRARPRRDGGGDLLRRPRRPGACWATSASAIPGVEITLTEASTDDLVAGLRDGSLDLALVALPAADVDGLETRVVTEDVLVAAVGAEHPLGRSRLDLRARPARPGAHQPAARHRAALAARRRVRGRGVRAADRAGGRRSRRCSRDWRRGGSAPPSSPPRSRRVSPASCARCPIVRPELRGALALAWRAGGPASPAGRALVRHALVA